MVAGRCCWNKVGANQRGKYGWTKEKLSKRKHPSQGEAGMTPEERVEIQISKITAKGDRD